jgi:hypothetical protein
MHAAVKHRSGAVLRGSLELLASAGGLAVRQGFEPIGDAQKACRRVPEDVTNRQLSGAKLAVRQGFEPWVQV